MELLFLTVTVLCTYFPSFSTSFQRVILTLGELVSWWVKTSTLKAYYVNFLQPTLPMDPSESCSLHYMAFVIPSKICSTLPELLSSPKMALEIERNYSLITTLLYLSFSDHILSIFFFFFTILYLFVWMLLLNIWNFYSSYWIWKRGILAAWPWLHLLAFLDQIFSSTKWKQIIATLSGF